MKIPQQTQRGQRPRVAGQTQRGQSPEGQIRPSKVRAQRATTDPAWSKALRAKQGPAWSKAQGGRSDPARSEPRGPQQTQRGQRPEGQTRPSEVRALRVCEEQTRTCATARGPVCQQASVPCNPNLPLSVVTGRGRHVPAPSGGASGLSFRSLLPPSLLSSVVFPCWFLGCFLEAGGVR